MTPRASFFAVWYAQAVVWDVMVRKLARTGRMRERQTVSEFLAAALRNPYLCVPVGVGLLGTVAHIFLLAREDV